MTAIQKIESTKILVKGLIQGIGFRPFIYRIANKHKLKGIVYNQNNGVVIVVQGTCTLVEKFILSIKQEAPKAAGINEIERKTVYEKRFSSFEIVRSRKVDNSVTQVSPDIAVCNECLKDMQQQPNRINYSFINCTNCGPRFSIVENIPYDRQFTSMKHFNMCSECEKEYINVSDRRFHAQPVACSNCGPQYSLQTGTETLNSIDDILNEIKKLIKNGGTIAMKGLGGFHLVCDALNAKAVEKIRHIKKRDGKPFALMFNSIEAIKKYTNISREEENIICSWQRPIVLVNSKTKFPAGISGDLTTLGVFLPYLPFHYQLFNAIESEVLVMTSCNISNCPIITENEEALKEFYNKADAVLVHNRDIVNRLDDSVVHKIGNDIQIIRRSRGYAPRPILCNLNTDSIFAVGAELSNTFCIGKGQQAIFSQHIGDLKNLETMQFFEESFDRMKLLFEFEPKHIICDLHPEYISTRFAKSFGLPVIETQHHHAHIAACMAEYELDEPVIGLSYDGTGYGTDCKIWGSEIMVAGLSEFERKYHFQYVPIPGGDKVSKEPWRSAISYLNIAFEGSIPNDIEMLKKIEDREKQLVLLALEKRINSPESCSAGRLFDAVSSLLNICTQATYHAEAPILLEHHLKPNIKDSYPIRLNSVISWKSVIRNIVKDLNDNVSIEEISAKFHNTVVNISYEAIKKIHLETGINKVVLTGGSFQNKYLSENLLDLLHKTGFKPYISVQVPVNDGGIALGQMAIAAKTLELCV